MKWFAVFLLMFFLLVAHCFATISGTNTAPQWGRRYGGSDKDVCWRVIEVSGGYVLAGYTESFGSGGRDFWLLKVNTDGDSLWSKTFGGPQDDECHDIIQTSDGGFALVGITKSYSGDNNVGDFWLVKTNSTGDSSWSKTYGGDSLERCRSIVKTYDGNFALGGYTKSYGSADYDFWLVKVNSSGDSIWSQTYGMDSSQYCRDLIEVAADSGFLLVGKTIADDPAGPSDYFVVKADSTGDSLWSKTFGVAVDQSGGYESCRQALETFDFGFVLVGFWGSGANNTDFGIMKISASGDSLWANTFGGANDEGAYGVEQFSDSSFVIAGEGASFAATANKTDIWLVKTDQNGDSLWMQRYGDLNHDDCYSFIKLSDGSYILAGVYNENIDVAATTDDFWLVKTEVDGYGVSTGETDIRIQSCNAIDMTYMNDFGVSGIDNFGGKTTAYIGMHGAPGDYSFNVLIYSDSLLPSLQARTQDDIIAATCTLTMSMTINLDSVQLKVYRMDTSWVEGINIGQDGNCCWDSAKANHAWTGGSYHATPFDSFWLKNGSPAAGENFIINLDGTVSYVDSIHAAGVDYGFIIVAVVAAIRRSGLVVTDDYYWPITYRPSLNVDYSVPRGDGDGRNMWKNWGLSQWGQ